MKTDRIAIGIAAMLVLLCVAAGTAAAQSGDRPEVEKVVNAIDRLYRHDSSRTTMEMEIQTPHWTRSLKMEAWSEGMDKTFIRILEPRKERGMGTLRIENEMWNYLPKTNKVMKIPPSMMMSSWMGSDFKNNDLVKEFTFTDDYDFEYADASQINTSVPDPGAAGGSASGGGSSSAGGSAAGGGETLYLRCTPKPGKPIVWGHVIIAVDGETLIPIWEKYYDEHGELMRIMYFREVETFDGERLPSKMELVPQTKEGHRTTLHYIEAEFDVSIRGNVFTLRNLRTFRR